MERAIQYIEQTNLFVDELLKAGYKNVQVVKGRRFDRIFTDDAVRYFVDRNSWIIYGAKSPTQYNPRWEYGTLTTIDQFDWTIELPRPSTDALKVWTDRENAIVAGYKKRGRPRKVLVGAP